jgi:hypothetical protein
VRGNGRWRGVDFRPRVNRRCAMRLRAIRQQFRGLWWEILGYENFLKRRYRKETGGDLDLRNPRTLSEKVHWIMVHGGVERFAGYVDKAAVKDFVKERAGAEFVIPTIGVYGSVAEVDREKLPDAFVLKATHGSHWNVVVEDKSKVDWRAVEKKADKWLHSNLYYKFGEANYRYIQRRIVVEDYLREPSGDLRDYKFLCFHGEPRYVLVDAFRFTHHERAIYDMDWKRVPITMQFARLREEVPRPEGLGVMMEVCRKLARDFAFVRVDLYWTGGRVYFGELTFTPSAGLLKITPGDYDYAMGEMLDLSRYGGGGRGREWGFAREW